MKRVSYIILTHIENLNQMVYIILNPTNTLNIRFFQLVIH